MVSVTTSWYALRVPMEMVKFVVMVVVVVVMVVVVMVVVVVVDNNLVQRIEI